MTTAPWISRFALLGAVGAAATLLALPLPRTGAPAAPAAAAPAEPPALTLAYPKARTVDVAAVLPDGDSLVPLAVLDTGTVVGTLTTPNKTRSSLVVLRIADPAHPRILQSWRRSTTCRSTPSPWPVGASSGSVAAPTFGDTPTLSFTARTATAARSAL